MKNPVLLMAFVNMYTVLGNYLSSPTYNLTAEQILYFRLTGLFGMLLSPLAGRLTKRFEVRKVLQGGLLIAIFSLSSMGFVSYLSLLVMMSVCFVIGIAISVPSLVSLVGQLGGEIRNDTFYWFCSFSIYN
ncbi:multidrug transporter [Bacillus cereus]|nr:multidrug transporter [Bacillus cereus]